MRFYKDVYYGSKVYDVLNNLKQIIVLGLFEIYGQVECLKDCLTNAKL